MTRNSKIGARLIKGVRSGGTLAMAVSAAVSGMVYAQDQSAPAQEPALEEIMVTGSRIQRSGMTTPTPVTAVDAGELEAMSPGNLIEAFDQMPQFLNNASPATQTNYAGAAGASNLNLRGIGTNRTLVLLDGRRVVPANRLSTVDINLFPEAMIQRVEVVTGGASAAYGTDAVAGVANFMLDTDFDGVEVQLQGGMTSREDAENHEVSLSFGTDVFDRGHFIGSMTHYERDGIDNYEGRGWYQGWGLVTNPEWDADVGGVPRQLIAPNVVSTQYTFGGLINEEGSALNRLHFLPDGSAVPFRESALSAVGTGTQSQSVAPQFGGGDGDNVQADRGAQGGLLATSERTNLFGYFDYDLSDTLTLYAQGIYGDSRTEGVGNAPVLFDGWEGRIYQENPYLPENVRSVMEAEGLESFGFSRMHSSADLARGRLEQENKTFSTTFGFDAQLFGGVFDGWQLEGYYQYGKNKNRIDLVNFVRTDRLPMAMDAVIDPATGAITCNATLAGHPRYQNCVPINLLGEGNVTPEALDYVLGPDKELWADVEQHVAEISMNGEIWEGWGAGAISGAFGASYREDSIEQGTGPEWLTSMSTPDNDPALGLRGIPNGFAGDEEVLQFSSSGSLDGSYDVKEVFAEALVPLVSDVVAADQLDLNLSARWADYAGSGEIWAWKAGLDWQVYQDLRLRGTVSRDIRAANLAERFDRQGQGTSVEDPVFDDEQYAFTQTYGGNPDVEPEEADTITVGAVYQPGYLPGFSLALDYYSIEIDGAIGQLTTQRIVDDCFEGAADLCERVTRDPDTNRITHVENVYMNIAESAVSGIDMEATYTMPISLFGGDENLRFRALASWLEENSTTNPGAPTLDRAGEVGGGLGLPEYKATASVTYENGPFTAWLQQRYISSGDLNAEWVEGVDIVDNEVDAAHYTDLRLTYNMYNVAGGDLEIYGNVNNVFDEDPPIAANFHSFFGAEQVNQSLYDVLGRRFTLGLRYRY